MALASTKGISKQKEKIDLLENKIRKLQLEVGDSTRQSSETWHDNAPYEMLRSDISLCNRQLNDAHRDLNLCELRPYPPKLSEEKVVYGTHVTFERDGELQEVTIVGFGDSQPEKGRILYTSPLARALIGHYSGESYLALIQGQRTSVCIKKVSPITDPELT